MLNLQRNDLKFIHPFAPKKHLLFAGQVARRPTLARTLSPIADEGPNVIYTGPIVNSIFSTIQSTGRIMTLSDLANYSVQVYPALSVVYRGEKKVHMANAPTSGPVLLHVIGLVCGGYEM